MKDISIVQSKLGGDGYGVCHPYKYLRYSKSKLFQGLRKKNNGEMFKYFLNTTSSTVTLISRSKDSL